MYRFGQARGEAKGMTFGILGMGKGIAQLNFWGNEELVFLGMIENGNDFKCRFVPKWGGVKFNPKSILNIPNFGSSFQI